MASGGRAPLRCRCNPSRPPEALTLGVELELQLVSLSDLDLIDASPDLLELLGRRPFLATSFPRSRRA